MNVEGAPAVAGPFTVKDVSAAAFIKAYAAHLKKSGKVQLPAYVDLIKTGKAKELAPYDPDWYYIRMAAVARKVYINQGLGVGALSRQFGGAYRRGTRPQHHCRASRGLLRHILSQLQKNDIVETMMMENAAGARVSAGRRITSAGRRELDRVARSVAEQQA